MTRFYDDRITIVEWLHALEWFGDIDTALDAAYAIEKASRWTDAEAYSLINHWRTAEGVAA